MSLKKIILALTGVGLVIIVFSSINFYIEQNKHNHPISQMPSQASGEEKIPFTPAEIAQSQENANATSNSAKAPKLSGGMSLPNEIPPAMLEAMKKQGISVEDLRKSGNSMGSTGGDAPKMGMGGQFPEEMLKALEAQKNQQTPQNPQEQAIMRAINHVKSHNNSEEITALEKALALADKEPANVQNLTYIADVFLKHGEAKAAEIFLQKSVVLAPTNAELLYNYGQVLAQDFQFEKAAEQWERTITIEDRPEVRYSLAMLYRYKLLSEEKANLHFTKASQLPTTDKELAKLIKEELGKK